MFVERPFLEVASLFIREWQRGALPAQEGISIQTLDVNRQFKTERDQYLKQPYRLEDS